MIWFVWLAAAAIAGVTAIVFWDRIRSTVSTWLREHNLAHSDLMDAFLLLDTYASNIRARITLVTASSGTHTIAHEENVNERQLTAEQREQLARWQHAQTRIMDQLA